MHQGTAGEHTDPSGPSVPLVDKSETWVRANRIVAGSHPIYFAVTFTAACHDTPSVFTA